MSRSEETFLVQTHTGGDGLVNCASGWVAELKYLRSYLGNAFANLAFSAMMSVLVVVGRTEKARILRVGTFWNDFRR